MTTNFIDQLVHVTVLPVTTDLNQDFPEGTLKPLTPGTFTLIEESEDGDNYIVMPLDEMYAFASYVVQEALRNHRRKQLKAGRALQRAIKHMKAQDDRLAQATIANIFTHIAKAMHSK